MSPSADPTLVTYQSSSGKFHLGSKPSATEPAFARAAYFQGLVETQERPTAPCPRGGPCTARAPLDKDGKGGFIWHQ
ncbi:hypothetical protein JCM10213v2_005861 [Rhodosporidiobolus nylandii]